MKVISNEIVKMRWDADGFLEGKKSGFQGAIHIYDGSNGSIAVAFRDENAFVILDEDGNVCDRDELIQVIKAYYKEDEDITEDEGFVLLASGAGVDAENLEMYGLSEEDGEDIEARLNDLHPYWEETIVDSI